MADLAGVTTATDTATPSPPLLGELGILFVHGIGEQRRGSTLSAFGGPVFEWIRRWIGRTHHAWAVEGLTIAGMGQWFKKEIAPKWNDEQDSRRVSMILPGMFDFKRGKRLDEPLTVRPAATDDVILAGVALRDAQIRLDESNPAAPPHVLLDITTVDIRGEVEDGTWVMAEAWWADAFGTPRLSELLSWSVEVIPWVIGSHFGARVRRSWLQLVRAVKAHSPFDVIAAVSHLFVGAIVLLFGLAMSPVVLVALVGLITLALLPIPSVRAFVAGIQRTIAASVGDSFVLLSRPVEAAAVVARVGRDISWLSSRCKRLIIVAHSQGAAVTHLALQQRIPENVALLATVGSGLRKLEELRQLRNPRMHYRKASGMALFSLVAGVILTLAIAQPGPSDNWLAVFAAVCAMMLLVSSFALISGTLDIELGFIAQDLHDHDVRWMDYVASADPVPNGDLFDDQNANAPVTVHVRNRGSFFGDHNAYWTNLDEFVTGLVLSIAGTLQGKFARLFAGAADAHTRAVKSRRWRVLQLGLARKLAVVAAVFLIIDARDEWKKLLAWAAVRSWVGLESLLQLGGGPTASVPLPAFDLWRTVGVLALFGLGYVLVGLAWRNWDRVAIMAFFNETDGTDGLRFSFGLYVVAVGLMFAIAYALRNATPEAPDVRAIASFGLFVVVAAVFIGSWGERVSSDLRRLTQLWSKRR